MIKPSSWGDIIQTLPAVSLLRRRFPTGRLSWVANSIYAPFLEQTATVDEVIPFHRHRYRRSHFPGWVGPFLTWSRRLARRRFDLAIDFQGLFRSGLIAYLSRACHRVGYSRGREGSSLFYTEQLLPPDRSTHAVEKYGALVSPFTGGASLSPDETYLTIPDEEITCVRKKFRLPTRYICLAPGARWSSKLWPPKRYGELVVDWSDQVVILGGPEEKATGKVIGEIGGNHITVAAGETTFFECAALIAGASLFVGSESGPMHIAALVKTPTVALFGPNRPEYVRPWGTDHKVVSVDGLDCLGCEEKTCPLPVHRCMDELTVDEVAAAVERVSF